MVLTAHPRLHIAKLQQQLKAKGIALDKRMTGTILDLLKQTGKVKQEGFEYSLVRK
jgi:hypothetical protein